MALLLAWLLAPLAFLRLALGRKSPTPQRILLIQTAKIGDYICTTPLIRALRREFPAARLSLLVNPVAEALARNQPGVDAVFTLPGGRLRGFSGRWKFFRLLRAEGIDTCICISPNQAFLIVPFLAGVQRRASILPNFGGRSYRLAAPFLSVGESHQQGRLMVETGMALLAQIGVRGPLPAKEIEAAPGAAARVARLSAGTGRQRLIGLGVSSGNKLKELGSARLIDLAQQLLAIEPSIALVLVGAQEDRALAAEVGAALDPARVVDSTGGVALADLPALIDQLDLYLGVDSGITYLADARGIPVVDIMGPADPEDQRPTGRRAFVIHATVDCAPCSHAFLAPYTCAVGTRACIRQLDNSRVTLAVRKMLFDEDPGVR